MINSSAHCGNGSDRRGVHKNPPELEFEMTSIVSTLSLVDGAVSSDYRSRHPGDVARCSRGTDA
jgi:hypothetical protein